MASIIGGTCLYLFVGLCVACGIMLAGSQNPKTSKYFESLTTLQTIGLFAAATLLWLPMLIGAHLFSSD